jgi:hypothetical protein
VYVHRPPHTCDGTEACTSHSTKIGAEAGCLILQPGQTCNVRHLGKYVVLYDRNHATCEAAGYDTMTDPAECEDVAQQQLVPDVDTFYGFSSAYPTPAGCSVYNYFSDTTNDHHFKLLHNSPSGAATWNCMDSDTSAAIRNAICVCRDYAANTQPYESCVCTSHPPPSPPPPR